MERRVLGPPAALVRSDDDPGAGATIGSLAHRQRQQVAVTMCRQPLCQQIERPVLAAEFSAAASG